MANFVLAGFGGQGVLFAGKVIAHAGMMEGQHVSWLPAYGPEMRGGTANCSVCLSQREISCPLVLHPDVFIAMNQPSYDRFIDAVAPGGLVVLDSTLVEHPRPRADVSIFAIPATGLAEREGFDGLSNMILLGKALRETGFASAEAVEQAVLKCVPPKKQRLARPNIDALRRGISLPA